MFPLVTKINSNKNLPRMLGYPFGQPILQSQFGAVTTNFKMDDVKCIGNETSLLDCPHATSHNCGSREGAGVICSNGMIPVLLAQLIEFYFGKS